MTQLQRFIVLGIGLLFGALALKQASWIVYIFVGIYLALVVVEVLIWRAKCNCVKYASVARKNAICEMARLSQKMGLYDDFIEPEDSNNKN